MVQHKILLLGFKPGLVWLKERFGTQWHGLYDSIRGVGAIEFMSNSDNAAKQRP